MRERERERERERARERERERESGTPKNVIMEIHCLWIHLGIKNCILTDIVNS